MKPGRFLPLALVLGCAGTWGCGNRWEEEVPLTARSVMEAPDSVELLALLPYPELSPGAPLPEGIEGPLESFHDYGILGRQREDEAEAVAQLMQLVREGINASEGMAALCFNPRHGLRIERAGRVVDLVICYECLQIRSYGPGEEQEQLLTSDRVEPAVSSFFRHRGLALHR
ncbi:MAG: hypothetical protein AAF682_30760 [Planctomycetota bacterium]